MTLTYGKPYVQINNLWLAQTIYFFNAHDPRQLRLDCFCHIYLGTACRLPFKAVNNIEPDDIPLIEMRCRKKNISKIRSVPRFVSLSCKRKFSKAHLETMSRPRSTPSLYKHSLVTQIDAMKADTTMLNYS